MEIARLETKRIFSPHNIFKKRFKKKKEIHFRCAQLDNDYIH